MIDPQIALAGRPAQFEYPNWHQQALTLAQLKAAAGQEQLRNLQGAQIAQGLGEYQRLGQLFQGGAQPPPGRTLGQVGQVATQPPPAMPAEPNPASPTYAMDQMSPETQQAGREQGLPVATPQAPAAVSAPAPAQAPAKPALPRYLDPEFHAQILAVAPMQGPKIVGQFQEIAQNQLKLQQEQLALGLSKVNMALQFNPEDQAGYTAMLKAIQAVGGDTSQMDPTYSPQNVQRMQQMAIPLKERLELALKERKAQVEDLTARAAMKTAEAKTTSAGADVTKAGAAVTTAGAAQTTAGAHAQTAQTGQFEALVKAEAEKRERMRLHIGESGSGPYATPTYGQPGQGTQPLLGPNGQPLPSKEQRAPALAATTEQLKNVQKVADTAQGVHQTLDEASRLIREGVYERTEKNILAQKAYNSLGRVLPNYDEATLARTKRLQEIGSALVLTNGNLGNGVSEGDRKTYLAATGSFAEMKTQQSMRESLNSMRRVANTAIGERNRALEENAPGTLGKPGGPPSMTPRPIASKAQVDSVLASGKLPPGTTRQQVIQSLESQGYHVDE